MFVVDCAPRIAAVVVFLCSGFGKVGGVVGIRAVNSGIRLLQNLGRVERGGCALTAAMATGARREGAFVLLEIVASPPPSTCYNSSTSGSPCHLAVD